MDEDIQRFNEQLTSIYAFMNTRLFKGELPALPVEAVTGKEYLGCQHSYKGTPKRITLNIEKLHSGNAEDDAEKLIEVMLHEMTHVYCEVHGIPHYDKETKRHLEGFTKVAESHGLLYDDGFMELLLFDLEEIFGPGELEIREEDLCGY